MARARVIQDGTGTGNLTGNNTYTGSTTVSAGTLKAGSLTAFSPNSEFTVNSILDLNGFDNTIGSLSGKGVVLNNGVGVGAGPAPAALTVGNDNSSSTFEGVLEDGASTLQLIKSGAGTLTLTGDSSYTGGTIISAGTLQLGNGGTSGSILGDVADNGILVFDRSDTTTFAGDISGLGSVTQIGTGTTILTGTNTYTGGTTISAGTLQLGNGGPTGSIVGNIIDNGALTFDLSGVGYRLPERSAARAVSIRSGLGRRFCPAITLTAARPLSVREHSRQDRRLDSAQILRSR